MIIEILLTLSVLCNSVFCLICYYQDRINKIQSKMNQNITNYLIKLSDRIRKLERKK